MPTLSLHSIHGFGELLRRRLVAFQAHNDVSFHALEIDRFDAGNLSQRGFDITKVEVAVPAPKHQHHFLLRRRLRDMPDEVQPLYRLSQVGVQALSNLELLALALGGANGSPARITLRARPEIKTAYGPIRYPKEIDIVDKEFRAQ